MSLPQLHTATLVLVLVVLLIGVVNARVVVRAVRDYFAEPSRAQRWAWQRCAS